MLKKIIVAGLALGFAAGCATPEKSVGQVTLTSKTWGYYQEYLRDIQPNRPGAFAVSVDGRSAYYYYCEEVLCVAGAGYRKGALDGCKRWGKECVVFAYRDDILIPYKVAE